MLSDRMKGGVLVARTTYHELWMYGTIVVDQMAMEYLFQLVDQHCGQGIWSAMEARIARICARSEVFYEPILPDSILPGSVRT